MGFERALCLPRGQPEVTRGGTFRDNIRLWLLEERRRA